MNLSVHFTFPVAFKAWAKRSIELQFIHAAVKMTQRHMFGKHKTCISAIYKNPKVGGADEQD